VVKKVEPHARRERLRAVRQGRKGFIDYKIPSIEQFNYGTEVLLDREGWENQREVRIGGSPGEGPEEPTENPRELERAADGA